MTIRGRLRPPSRKHVAVVAALVGGYNLLAVVASVVQSATLFARVEGYQFGETLSLLAQARLTAHWSGFAVPLAAGAGVLAIGHLRGAPVEQWTPSPTARVRNWSGLVVGVIGAACWIPVVALPLLSLGRLVLGYQPVIHDGRFYLSLLVAGAGLLVLADILYADR